MRYLIITLLIIISNVLSAQTEVEYEVINTPIGTKSSPAEAEVKLELIERFQHYNSRTASSNDHFDKNINSPKSALFSPDDKKLYVQSLEGYETLVYSADSFEKIKVIEHIFDKDDTLLFQDTLVFDYKYRYRRSDFNIFSGKPVESTFSHDGKYLWVTYYRRSFDRNAVSPSGVAIINTENDSIVRVMPTGPLPKMIAASPNNKYVAVTHWGDNTIGIIDISSNDPQTFRYVKQFVVDKKMKLDFDPEEKVDRDNGCGFCLRGTVFTPEGDYLMIGRMGGNGGIAIFNMDSLEYIGSVWGMKINIRHLVINNDWLILSSNIPGYVQKAKYQDVINARLNCESKMCYFKEWESVFAGKGLRTISASSDGKYIFACANNESKIAVVRSSDMKVISEIPVDSFPVGMDLSNNDKLLVVTSQGRSSVGGGNSVMVFKVEYP
ncbi:MAG: hypothetical protein RH860_16390 [Cytophagales bacterium]